MNKKYYILLSTIGLLLLLGGVTYSFFNYTRTGNSNTLGTGVINFNTTQGEPFSLTNAFPMTSEEAANANLATVSLDIVGNTTYSDGVEFLVTLVDVNNTINGKSVPLNFFAEYSPKSGKTIGTNNEDYFDITKDTNIYKLNSTGKVIEDKQVLVGFIKGNTDGIDGTLVVRAYVDADRIAITDTPETNVEWQRGREVFSTSEWNSIKGNNAISFKVKAEANEGLWVEEEERDDVTPSSCFTFNTENDVATIIKYDVSCGIDVVIPKKISYVSFLHNTSMTNQQLNTCSAYLVNKWDGETSIETYELNTNNQTACTNYFTQENGWYFDEGETPQDFCQGTGTMYGETFEQIMDDYLRNESTLISNLLNQNIITGPVTKDITNKYVDFCSGTKTINDLTFQQWVDGSDYDSFELEDLSYFEQNSMITRGTEAEYTITAIDNYAFYGLSQAITSVVIPNGVTSIGEAAFAGNLLTSINIPNSVTTIGYAAFASNSLTTVTLGNSLEEIGANAFEGYWNESQHTSCITCAGQQNSISSVTIPASVTSMPCNAFANQGRGNINIQITYENPNFTCSN